jgi:DNA mismatch endonuclease, patch repair protein
VTVAIGWLPTLALWKVAAVPLSRSQQMARIKGRDTSAEKLLRHHLWKRGLRYRVNARTPAGRGDVVFTSGRLAVFVDGCFWHGCPDHYVRPRSRTDFWSAKLAGNVARDCAQTSVLQAAGWSICRLWEHEVFENPDGVAERVVGLLRGREPAPSPAWRVAEAHAEDIADAFERWLLVDLYDPEAKKTIIRRRTTRKWRAQA